jgi:hypothetical protein
MSDLLYKVLTDKSARTTKASKTAAANAASEFSPWASVED